MGAPARFVIRHQRSLKSVCVCWGGAVIHACVCFKCGVSDDCVVEMLEVGEMPVYQGAMVALQCGMKFRA